MELLAKLLGGVERVKIMRFFLHHRDIIIQSSDLADKTKSRASLLRKELTTLTSIGFIEKKKTRVIVAQGKKTKIKEVYGFSLCKEFSHNEALEKLLFDFKLFDKKELASRFKSIGRIKLFLVSGLFLAEEKSRVDILIVGEAIKKQKAEKVFEMLSAELGREVVYSLMDVEEYEYRVKMYDKFMRDIIEMPNEIIIDKLKEKIS